MQVLKQVDLRQKNTLGLPCVADTLILLESEKDLSQLKETLAEGVRPLILGGGSNVILPEQISQPVLSYCAKGTRYRSFDDGSTLVEVDAGVVWDELVEACAKKGLRGIENLSLIPGLVGAAPVQNIGAYGVELRDVLETVRVYDFERDEVSVLSREQCQFAYRDSLFKRQSGRYLILSVSLRLDQTKSFSLNYGELKVLSNQQGLTAMNVRNEVIRVRQAKLPDPKILPNAGSFFKNPIVSNNKRDELLERFPKLVSYSVDDEHCKLAAGWMIDQAGWKGARKGAFAVHEKQALVLVRIDDGNKNQLISLAESIQSDIEERYGVALEIEPVSVESR